MKYRMLYVLGQYTEKLIVQATEHTLNLCYNTFMKNIIQFQISQGAEYYTAEGVNTAVVTQGKTLDELAVNIHEAVQLHLEGENLEERGLGQSPSVLINFELPQIVHA